MACGPIVVERSGEHGRDGAAAGSKRCSGKGLVKVRDKIVFMAGQPIGRPGTTNFVKLHRMGETW